MLRIHIVACLCILLNTLISRTKEVDLIFFYSHCYFLFDLFSFILFLELGLGLE